MAASVKDDMTRDELLETIERQELAINKMSQTLETIQSRTRKILTSLPLGLLILNDEMVIEAANSRIEQIFSYTPRELAGQKIQIIFPDLETVEADALPKKTPARVKSHDYIVCEIFANEYEDDGVKRIFLHVQDVTEKQRLEQLRKDFVQMVSHDLRTPLTSINMLLSMLSQDRFGKLDEQGYTAVERARSNADYLIKLVSDLLDAEKLESGDLEIEIQPTSVKNVISKTVDATQDAAKAQKVSLETEAIEGGFLADEDRLVQVLINLVSNAVKYSEAGSSVTIKGSINGEGAVFSVIDRGPGIPAHQQEAIFQRYKQLNQPKKLKRRGFGLGLAICKALVEAHKGKIWLESEEGKGSTFSFAIPNRKI
jgi:PAS domain S-box-containing protein